MKTSLLKITSLGLVAAALFAAPALTRAADPTNPPAAYGQDTTSKHKRSDHAITPFNGKLSGIDTNAMTIKVGERTFEITSETKITKDGFPATLADGVVGEKAGGAYKKTDDGKLTATSVRFGASSGTAKKKKAAAESSGTTTNSVTK